MWPRSPSIKILNCMEALKHNLTQLRLRRVWSSIFQTFCKQTKVTLKNNTVKSCDPSNCSLSCGTDNRVKLTEYTYRRQDINNPFMLFRACSFRTQCIVDDALASAMMNITPDGTYKIKYECIELATKVGLCDAIIETNQNTTSNLIYQYEATSALSDNQQPRLALADILTCSCHITGLFKIEIIDLRLTNGTITYPSVSVKVCNTGCRMEHFNSSKSVQFNGGITKHATSSEIHLETSKNYSVMAWIQISRQGKGIYSIDCSTVDSTHTTKVTETTEITTTLDTAPSTILSTHQSAQEDVSTLLTYSSVPPTYSSSSVSTQGTPIPEAHHGDVGNEEDSVPTVGIVLPVVLVIIGSACALGAVIIYRRRRKRKRNLANSIVNQSYEDTTDDLHIPSVSDKMRSGSESFDSGIPESNTDYSNVEPQADDQYNVIENDIDEEYNKISFQPTPIPFDKNYGHINPTNHVQNEEYDHVDRVQEMGSQTYSHVNQQVLKDEAESKGQSTNTQSNQNTKHTSDSTYDHLAMSIGKDPQDLDELQDDYSHLPSTGANTAHAKPRRGNRDRNEVKPYDFPNTAKQNAESKDTEHAYFVLESDNNAAMPQTESNTTDTAVHPYFIIEPSATLPYTQIEKNIGETAEHSYFTLEPDTHSMKQ